MMAAIRETIFAEIENRLDAIDGVSEVERMPSGDPDKFPALHIFDGGQRPGDSEVGDTRYDMSVTVHGYIDQPGGASAHTALNNLYALTVAALVPDMLGGLVETIDEGPMQVELATRAADRRLVFIVDFFLTFPTRRGDPAMPA